MLAETVVEAARRFGDRPALVAEEGWSCGWPGAGSGVGTWSAWSCRPCPSTWSAAKVGAVTAALDGAALVVEEPAGGALPALRAAGRAPRSIEADPSRPVAVVFHRPAQGGGLHRSMAGSAPAHLGPMTKLAGNLRRGTTQ